MSSSHSQEEYTVRLGDKLLHFRSETTPVVPVQDIVCHRFYEEKLRRDATLVLLAFSVNYSSYIQPVRLPERACHVESGTERWVTRWSRVAGSVTDSQINKICEPFQRTNARGPRVWSEAGRQRWHLPDLMAALPFSHSAGPGASGLWGLSRCVLLLLPLLTSDFTSSAEDPCVFSGRAATSSGLHAVCGKPWWSEDLEVTRHWPWEVSLRLENEHVCGGALIDLNWVVTAAHCIQGTKEYSVILGTSKLKPLQASLIPVKDIILHPKFWGRTFIMGDMALLQLHSPATFSKYVQPICLPEPSYNLKVGTQCWVTGWGQVKQRFSANSTLTTELQEAEVFIMDNKKCDQIYRKKSFLPHLVPLVLGDMICATNYGENLCSGDSGGPLACEVEGRWILAGVLSWEKACAKAENPGVYTRITKYSKWIRKQIGSEALSGPPASTWLLLLLWLLQPQMGP
ncbi:putative serine protease 45 [Mustela nigripes]|uniref:putative serine protease 45 n=1 Tax=Mustela nigripes TaxID=77151 RepID=UPI0028156145|nr:putative serine protease 45 [Mustela nigripes]